MSDFIPLLSIHNQFSKGGSLCYIPYCGRKGARATAVSMGTRSLSLCVHSLCTLESCSSGTPVMPFLTMLPLLLPEEAISTNEVINQLLHHVGAMCIHQLNLLATNPNLPITSVLGKQHPIEARHLSSICDIMEKAMVNGDTCIVRCILVVFQVHILCGLSKMTQTPPRERLSATSVLHLASL